MKQFLRRYYKLLIAIALLVLMCLGSVLAYRGTAHMMDSQRAAERWRGDSEMSFAQLSCFMPADEQMTMQQIYELRMAMQTKLHEAALDVSNDNILIHDAWSATGSVKVSNGKRSGDVSVTAVGGRFFDFHPIKLVSGNYISPDDLMKDRVLLDKETAWLLFGGTELSGMSFRINGLPYVVAGVIEGEDDRFSRKAYTGGQGIYMSYEGYCALFQEEQPGIDCYEIVLPEPVSNFAYTAVQERFPIKTAELIDNSKRYEVEKIWAIARNMSVRSMHMGNVSYPYWENAARASENTCVYLLVAAVLSGVFPLVLSAVLVVKLLWRGKAKLENDIVPELKDKAEEAIRVRARKRWEKKHPDKV